MNAEIRAKVEETIKTINQNIIAEMLNEDKNSYDKEIQLPENVTTPEVVHKRAYNTHMDTVDNAKNKKRRENRPSVLEQCILDGRHDEAKEMIQKMHYTAITNLSKSCETICNEKTAIKILKEMLTMIGYDVEMIPADMVYETVNCIKKWSPYARTLYKYNRGEIEPLDMKENEMTRAYDTYILTKKLILINSHSKTEYDNNIAKLNKKMKPVYAAIRAQREIE